MFLKKVSSSPQSGEMSIELLPKRIFVAEERNLLFTTMNISLLRSEDDLLK